MDLFRPEVMEHKRDTWLGDLIAAKPLTRRYLVGIFVVVALIMLAYLCIGERTRREAVSGYVVPEEGLIKVFTYQQGTITSMKVKEGEFVKRGTVLAAISFERRTGEGALRHQIDQNLAQRKLSMEEQRRSSDANFTQQTRLVAHRIEKFRADLATLDQSLHAQQERLAVTREMVENEGKLAQDGYVGKAEFLASKVRLMDEENRVRELERQKRTTERELIGAQIELQGLPVRALQARSELLRGQDEIAQQQIENEDRRENLILAPADGTVTAIQKGAGKFVSSGQPVLSLVPSGARLAAQFYVTSDAIGFLRTGSEARMQLVAFPHQKFGSFKGQVVSVSRTAVPADELPFPVANSTRGESELYYIVQVKPDQNFITAYGKKEMLQPGMEVNAKIWVDRRKLIEWVFEPLYSISGRTW